MFLRELGLADKIKKHNSVYLTFFYTKHELALRVGYLFVSAAIAGAVGGLLAYGIGHLDGVAGMSGWRWIMIIEGLPSVLLGVAAFFLLPNDLESAYFLNDKEKEVLLARQSRDYGMTKSAMAFSAADMKKAFKDWKVWIFCIAQFGADTMLYGLWFLNLLSTFRFSFFSGLSSIRCKEKGKDSGEGEKLTIFTLLCL